LLFPIITGAIGQVLGTMAVEQIQPRHKGRHSADARRSERLTSKQAQDLHDKCQALALAKLPPAEAAQLADAILGTLRSEDWRLPGRTAQIDSVQIGFTLTFECCGRYGPVWASSS
jgi:hypothetical protein